jgi:hypothetical protein
MCQSGPNPVSYILSMDPDPDSETNSQNISGSSRVRDDLKNFSVSSRYHMLTIACNFIH